MNQAQAISEVKGMMSWFDRRDIEHEAYLLQYDKPDMPYRTLVSKLMKEFNNTWPAKWQERQGLRISTFWHCLHRFYNGYCISESSDPEIVIINRLMAASLTERLPEHLKRVIYMKYWLEMKRKEIARIEGITIAGVAQRLVKALRLMREANKEGEA